MKKLSFTQQIIVLLVTMGIMGVWVGFFGISNISAYNKQLNDLLSHSYKPYQNAQEISGILESSIYRNVEKAEQGTINLSQLKQLVDSDFEIIDNLLGEYKPDAEQTNEQIHFKQMETHIDELKKHVHFWISDQKISNRTSLNSTSGIFKKIQLLQSEIDDFCSIQTKKTEQLKEISNSELKRIKFTYAVILLIGVITSMVVSLIILISVKTSLTSTNKLIRKMATGDLTTVIVRKGGKDFGVVQDNLRDLSNKFTEILELAQITSQNINYTSHELSSNAQTISDGANQQAASIEEIASAMEEISSHIQENTKHSISTQEISTKVYEEVKLGSAVSKNTLDAIKSIASKISVIGDIAFQTNLLALNAAVEAARAGDHGKGFGVVAAEVGKLAERSKNAAFEINKLSKSGVELASETQRMLEEFVADIDKSSKLVSHITITNLEQNTGIQETNSSVQVLNKITQQNAASSEEMATVAEQLAAQSQLLQESIAYFKLKEHIKSGEKETKFLKSGNKTEL